MKKSIWQYSSQSIIGARTSSWANSSSIQTQKVLFHLNDQRLNTAWQQKVFTRLLGLQYQIVYKPGTDNRVANALSQRQHPEEVMAISSAVPSWLDDIVSSYASDTKAHRCSSLHPAERFAAVQWPGMGGI